MLLKNFVYISLNVFWSKQYLFHYFVSSLKADVSEPYIFFVFVKRKHYKNGWMIDFSTKILFVTLLGSVFHTDLVYYSAPWPLLVTSFTLCISCPFLNIQLNLFPLMRSSVSIYLFTAVSPVNLRSVWLPSYYRALCLNGFEQIVGWVDKCPTVLEGWLCYRHLLYLLSHLVRYF